MKKWKKLVAGVFAAILSLSSVVSVKMNVSAEETVPVMASERTGYESLKKIDLGERELPKEPAPQNNHYLSSRWNKYASRYFYNQLNSNQKVLYDAVYDRCMYYLTTQANAEYYDSSTGFTAPVLVGSSMSEAEIKQVIFLFLTNNPQFYFVNSYYGSGTTGSQSYIQLGIYPEWVSGSSRSNATNRISSAIDTWMNVINAEKTVLAKERKIHDLVVANTTYAFTDYDQSCAGVFLEGKAVCAGYSEAFALLCNGAGINALCVTSAEHEWNIVQIYGKWYNVDCTMDDPDSNWISYNFFNVSDATAQADGYHYLEPEWNGLNVPACYSDTVDESASFWSGDKYYVNGQPQSNVFRAPVRENPSISWYYFAYSTDDASAGTKAYEIRTGWLRDEKTGKLHFAFPENGLLMANMWSSDHKYYFDGLDLAIGKFVADDGYTYFSYSENAIINGQKVTGIVQSGWVMDEQTGDLYFCFPENYRMARGIQLGSYIFDDSGKCLNP